MRFVRLLCLSVLALGCWLLSVPCQAQSPLQGPFELPSAASIAIDVSKLGTFIVKLTQETMFTIKDSATADRAQFQLEVFSAKAFKVTFDPKKFKADFTIPFPAVTSGTAGWDAWLFVYHDDDRLWHLKAVTPGAYVIPAPKGGE
jgi:hypothetical protein